jgi:glucose/arabinose dehydrogenase/cytochrome c553
MKTALTPVLILVFGLFTLSATAQQPAERYAQFCASCHSAEKTSLASSPFVTQSGEAQLAAFIRGGRPSRGMPSFAAALPEAEARALAGWLKAGATTRAQGTMIGQRIEAESLRADRSAGYSPTTEGETKFLQYIDRGSHLCYDDIDLTGIRSLELRYAKGEGEPPRRVALVAFEGDFASGRRFTLGEKTTELTGGWSTFRDHRIGLSRQLTGRYRLCIIGMGGGGVFNLDSFMLSDVPAGNDGITQSFDVKDEVHSAAGHSFKLEKVAEIDGEFWSLDFLDAQTLIATQKGGSLWMFERGKRIGPIAGIPPVYLGGQGGLLHVRAHPDYSRNGWIYLSFTEGSDDGSMMTIVRGRIRDAGWVDTQVIYRAAPGFFTASGAHFGARFTFDGDYLFFSVGERGTQENAQNLKNPFGKIHRIFSDGRVPTDNPFAATPGAVPTIWSLGHRNPQGLVFDTATRVLWSSEHGPKGGDEVNLILPGRNYGWPLVTHGINYDGTRVSADSERAGFEPPRAHWNPSPGMSNLVRYDGRAFPRWRNHLLVACLAQQHLKLLRLENDRVIGEDVLLEGAGRIRDVITGPDGLPYIALNQPNGRIYRLKPSAR